MTTVKKPLTEDDDPAVVLLGSASFLLNKAGIRLRERLDLALSPLGLTGKLLSVLKILNAEGAHTQHELGYLGCIDRSSAVVFIDALEKQGLAERRRKPGDRRAHVVSLTEKGRRTLPKAKAIEAKVQRAYLACFEAPERRALLELLSKLVLAHKKGFICD
jgi:MarR family transcriptional regulator for hemolysin